MIKYIKLTSTIAFIVPTFNDDQLDRKPKIEKNKIFNELKEEK